MATDLPPIYDLSSFYAHEECEEIVIKYMQKYWFSKISLEIGGLSETNSPEAISMPTFPTALKLSRRKIMMTETHLMSARLVSKLSFRYKE